MICEKCWTDAYHRSVSDPTKPQVDHYHDLIEERKNNPCSPSEQAGDWWDEEKQCDSRREGGDDGD